LGAVGPGGAGKASKSGTRWLIAGGGAAAAAIVAVVVVVIVTVGGNNPNPTPPPPPSPPPTVAPAALKSLLLTGSEIDSILGTTNLEPSDIYNAMSTDPLPISIQDCAGAHSNALNAVYAGSGYSTVADQLFSIKEPDFIWAEQSAVLFPSADQARAFLSTSADKWKRCAGHTATVTLNDGGQSRWTFNDVTEEDSQISQLSTQEAAGGKACQHVIRVVSNVVIEAQTCHDHVTDEANRMAEQMAAKAPT
jgi:serine/threonine-protein kinase